MRNRPGCVNGSEKLFNGFLDKRAGYEQPGTRPKETADRLAAVAELKGAANAYITRFDGKDKKYQRDQANIQRRNLCTSTIHELNQLELAEQINKLPQPPWTSPVAANAAELKVKLDLASLPPGKRQAESFSDNNASPTFWINKDPAPGTGKPAKSFFSSPPRASPPTGFPPMASLPGKR